MALKSSSYGVTSFPSTFEVEKSTTLQKTDMGNGNNKFYVLELHKSGNKYRLYSRYGRTGAAGTEEERIPHSSWEAENEYDRIIRSKEKKGYKQVAMAVTSMGSAVGNTKVLSDDVKKAPAVVKSKSSLDPELASFVNRLYSDAGQACISQLNVNTHASSKNPLGTLTGSQISGGRTILKEINSLLTKKPTLIGSIHKEIVEASNEFYSMIPHEIPLRPRDEEGRKEHLKRYCLNNPNILDEKSDFLDILEDVEGLISGFESDDTDKKYEQIKCKYQLCSKSSDDYQAVVKYIQKSKSQHHHWSIRVQNVWKMESLAQAAYRSTMDKVGNIEPLFHGSRPGNILGICQKGLLLRPPGAYVTGSMFGNGLYFADQSSKSTQYSTARFGGSSGNSNRFYLFVADVALGRIKEYEQAQMHLQKPPSGYDSVKGAKGRSLLHNEFIVYDIKQNQLQYIVEFTQS